MGQRFIDLAPQATWKHFNAGQIEHCDYVEAGLLPAGVSMMLQDGRVAGFGVSNAATVGPFGSSVGDTEAAARARLRQAIASHRITMAAAAATIFI